MNNTFAKIVSCLALVISAITLWDVKHIAAPPQASAVHRPLFAATVNEQGLRLNQLSPPNGAVAFNSQKAAGLANGTVAGDAVPIGQDATTSLDGLMAAADKLTFNQRFTDGLKSVSVREDDFRSGTTAGQMNWRAANPGTGNTIIQTATNQDSTHIGIIRLPTGNTAATQSSITTFAAGPIMDFQPDATAQENHLCAKVRFETLSNGTQQYKWMAGYLDTAVASPANKIAVEYDSANDTHFRLTACNTSTCNSVNGSTTVVAANTWYYVCADHAAGASAWTMSVNGTQEASNSTDIPTAQMGLAIAVFKSIGTTDLNIYLDFVREVIVWASGR